VVLLRHGETAWSLAGKHTGLTDVPLTAAGREQARETRSVLRRLALADPLALSSPRARARDTAELAGLGRPETTELLAEWDYGDYEGTTTAEIRRTVPGWTVWTHPCPGGESAESVQSRADAVLEQARAAERDVVLVGHGHFSRALLARWVGLAVTAGIHFGMSPAGVAVLGYEHGREQIMSMNIQAVPR
jgi:broad specificity phosphatase PhoE